MTRVKATEARDASVLAHVDHGVVDEPSHAFVAGKLVHSVWEKLAETLAPGTRQTLPPGAASPWICTSETDCQTLVALCRRRRMPVVAGRLETSSVATGAAVA